MDNEKQIAIELYISVIEKTDFASITILQLPEFENTEIIHILSSFYREHLIHRSKHHPLVSRAIDAMFFPGEPIPLYPLYEMS